MHRERGKLQHLRSNIQSVLPRGGRKISSNKGLIKNIFLIWTPNGKPLLAGMFPQGANVRNTFSPILTLFFLVSGL